MMKKSVLICGLFAVTSLSQAAVMSTITDKEYEVAPVNPASKIAAAGQEIYSNLSGDALGGFPHGASGMLYDDITLDRFGVTETLLDTLEITFVNFDEINLGGGQTQPGAPLHGVDVTIEFRAADPVTGLPGDLLGDFNSSLDFSDAPIEVFAGGTAVLDLADLNLDVTDWQGNRGFFWIGVEYENATTADDLPLFAGDGAVGQLIFGPPTKGSSQDFIADHQGIFSFGGNPPANFGYELTTQVPEPLSVVMLAMGMILIRRR